MVFLKPGSVVDAEDEETEIEETEIEEKAPSIAIDANTVWLTSVPVAKLVGVQRSVLLAWCRAGKVPGAVLEARGDAKRLQWFIPEDAIPYIPKPRKGRPKNAKPKADAVPVDEVA